MADNNEKEPKTFQLNVRVTTQMEETIRGLCEISGRNLTNEVLRLIEAGLNMDALTSGPRRELLLDLFVAGRHAAELLGASAPLAILEGAKRHFGRGEWLIALDAFQGQL
jgi:hypothetical protein